MKRNHMKGLYINNEIQIQAANAQVWDVLANQKKTKIYMFGCETISDWKVGSTLLWQAF